MRIVFFSQRSIDRFLSHVPSFGEVDYKKPEFVDFDAKNFGVYEL